MTLFYKWIKDEGYYRFAMFPRRTSYYQLLVSQSLKIKGDYQKVSYMSQIKSGT